MTPIVKSGRYIDVRNGVAYTLARFNSTTLVFQGGYEVSSKDFEEYFVVATA